MFRELLRSFSLDLCFNNDVKIYIIFDIAKYFSNIFEKKCKKTKKREIYALKTEDIIRNAYADIRE